MDTQTPPLPPVVERTAAIGTGTLLLLLLWPLIVVAAAGAWLDDRRASDVARMGEDRPRVVVLNEADFVRATRAQGSPQAQAEAGLREADETASKLGDAGYVVLRANAILRAPGSAWVKPEAP